MRIIEDKLTEIVRKCLNGNYTKSFSKSPSRRDVVEYDHERSQVTVFLWNSAIVKVDTKERRVILDSCRHHTNTTKSRLNAFIQQFDSQVGGIYQKNWTWYRWTRCLLTGEDNPVEFNGKYEFTVN
tara:strand:- start:1402 stop:1779 length:378 start_codon:yes stop_codon:yes gene_type:complete